MIIGYLSNIESEMAFYPEAIQKGLKFLLNTDLASLSLGKHEIEGSQIYVSVAEYDSEPKEKRRLEAHVKYADIQYVLEGEEIIGCGPLAEASEVTEDRLSEKDVIFYKTLARETEVLMTKGMFAVYYPWDVHRPNCSVDGTPRRVRKLVVKVAMAAIQK